ncbi:hypothetical protein [Diplocloster modestus]|uniref:Uncharacterized protein n=1 Tax=Diplocloster modestus TaxID=2850322 RepID=A0ABS6KDL3_9FIRM|nr:hypothetical protein [Diplocloster modestus]MBU9728607.1 hypothetical protein [Diplocloster modestus]
MREYIKEVQEKQAVRSMIPMNFQMGLPILKPKDQELLVIFPYYRTKVEGNQIHMSLPRFHAVMAYPSGRLVRVEDLKYNGRFQDIDFSAYEGVYSRGIGEQAAAYREAVERYLDRAGALLKQQSGGAQITAEQAGQMQEELFQIIEPFYTEYYRRLLEE